MAYRKIDAMQKAYGWGNGTCKNCIHFRRNRPTERAYFKCAAYGDSASEATDWRANWIGCGLYNKPLPNGYRPLIEMLKREPRKQQDVPIDGQIRLEGIL